MITDIQTWISEHWQLLSLIVVAIIIVIFLRSSYGEMVTGHINEVRKKITMKKALLGIFFLSPVIVLVLIFIFLRMTYRGYYSLKGEVEKVLPNIPSWVYGTLLLLIVISILWKMRGFIVPKLSKISPTLPSLPKSVWGWVWRILATIIIINVAVFGYRWWQSKNPKGEKIVPNKEFTMTAGERYYLPVEMNEFPGIWPTVIGKDTVEITCSQPNGIESYKIWNDASGTRQEERITERPVPPGVGIFYFTVNKTTSMNIRTRIPG